jgi:hypothetical protein
MIIMKYLILLILCTTISLSVYGQNDTAYVGIPYDFRTTKSKYKSGWEKYTSNNGKVTKIGEPDHYEITPLKEGDATIYINRILQNGKTKLLDSLMHIKVIGLQVAADYLGKTTGDVDASDVYHSFGPSVDITTTKRICTDHWRNISQFELSIIRNGKTVFDRVYSDSVHEVYLDDEAHDFFKMLHNKDVLRFSNIVCIDFNHTKYPLQSLEFTVKNAEGLKATIDNEPDSLTDPITGQKTKRRKH